MNWKTCSQKIDEKKINFQINFPLLKKNIYGLLKKQDILQIFLLVEISNIFLNLFIFFSLGNIINMIFAGEFKIHFLQTFSNIFLIFISISILILSQMIKRKIEKSINIMENINWKFLNEKDLYELCLILTFLWIDEALKSNFLIRDLRKSIHKKYEKYCAEDLSARISIILEKIKHKTEEGSVIL